MGTAGRKARKRAQLAAGTSFQHPVKVGTPLTVRAWFVGLVQGPAGTRHEHEMRPRSVKVRGRALLARAIETEVE